MPSWQPGSSRTQGPLARAETAAVRTTPGRHNEDMEDLIFRLHQMLIEELDADQISSMPSEDRRRLVEQAADTVLRREMPSVGGITRDQIVARVVDEVVGLGPIDGMIRDPSVSEGMVHAPDEVYFEREGIIYLSDIRFRDADHVQRIIERIVAPLGRRVDESSPMGDARLPDGSRVNVILPPLSPKSPPGTTPHFRGGKT